MSEIRGEIVEVNGPVIKACGFSSAGIGDQVEVGSQKLIGEIIAIKKDIAIIQVYEDTTGLRLGMEVISLGHPISVELGPGLIGSVFDGLQRPLSKIAKVSPFIQRGAEKQALERERTWHVQPIVKVGDYLEENDIYAHIQETPLIVHKLLVPQGIKGEVIEVLPEGDYHIQDVIVKVKQEGKIKELKCYQLWPIRKPRPTKGYVLPDEPLITGQRVLDFFFPLAKGGTAIIPGGFGTGKTVTQHQLAKWSDADLIIYIGCGERGNEMTQVLEEFPKLQDPRTGRPLMERTILIANVSNMPVTAREASIYTGITMAEYFRDMGYNVAVMADSTSRWAEALREIAGRLEEMPAEEGYPSYLASRIAEFYERAGRRKIKDNRCGSISVIGAVSPPGGDFSEPVTQHSKRFTKVFWALDKELAGARHFPSVNWLLSYSQYISEVEKWWQQQSQELKWPQLREQAMAILEQDAYLQKVVRLIGPDALPDSQKLVYEVARIIKEGFLQQNAFDPNDCYCSAQKQLKIMGIILYFYSRAKQCLEKRIPVTKILQLPVVTDIVRAKSEISDEQLDKFEHLKENIDLEFSKLEKEYGSI